jgi:hypothetical protein
MLSNQNINYVKDIVSLNIQKIKDSAMDLEQQDIRVDEKGYEIQQIQ